MNLKSINWEPLGAVGAGSLVVVCCYMVSLGKVPIAVLAPIGGAGAVWVRKYQKGESIPIDWAAAAGWVVGIVGAFLAFSLLGVMGKLGWTPAGDLSELSLLYERHGLSKSEISIVYNIFVGDPVFKGVTIGVFLIVAVLGLIGGGITALAFRGWKLDISFSRETLYDWGLFYRAGQEMPLPPRAKKGFRAANILFLALCLGIVVYTLTATLYELMPSNDLVILAHIVSYFWSYIWVCLFGVFSFLSFSFTFFLFPMGREYTPYHLRSVGMALLSIALALIFLSRLFQ